MARSAIVPPAAAAWPVPALLVLLVLLVLLLPPLPCLATGPAPVAAATASAPAAEMLLGVQLNGIDTGDTALLLRDVAGRLLVAEADLQRWRLRLPAAAPSLHEGQRFHRLEDLAGLRWSLDDARQALALEADPASFDATRMDLAVRDFPRPQPAPTSVFLNYDLSTTRSANTGQTGALLELGTAGRLGTGVGSFALRNGFAGGPGLLRLETTWTRDLPDRRASLRLGDAVGRAGQWGRAVRLGGVQWASNFDTQPGFVSFPLPSLTGQAALPSTVDLYVNNALQLRREVPAGPFELQQLPVMTGQGEARLVVRDLLGREQVIVAPYFATPRLLSAGLQDFSYEAGRLREDFALASDHYGRTAVAGTHRLGVSDRLTLEARGEAAASQRTGGLGAVLWWPGWATVSAALAGSQGAGARSRGGLLALGAERLSGGTGFGVSAQFTTAGFRQLGQARAIDAAGQSTDAPAVRQNLQAYASLSLGPGSLSVSQVLQTPRDRDPVRLLSVGYGVSLGSLGSLGYLAMALLRSGGPRGQVTASLTFTRSLDNRGTLSAGVTAQAGQYQEQLRLQQSLPAGEGTGYRLLASGGARPTVEAGASLRHAAGIVSLDLASADGRPALRGSVNGGLAWIEGGIYASSRIDSSFALVQVPGQPGVGVYADNQLVARTGADGSALLPRLRAYQKNPVRIDQADIPLDVQVDLLAMDAVPAFRSGMVLRFPVRRSRSATLSVLQEDGRPVPAGARARIDPAGAEHPFGSGGQLYLGSIEPAGGASAATVVEVRWGSAAETRRCRFEISLPDGNDPIPDLGAVLCRSFLP